MLVAADVTQDCVLGIDVLGKHNCRIDLNGKSIKIGKEVVSLKGKNESSKVFGLSAFRVLKEKLVSASVLAFPCFDQELIVDCDASDDGLGPVISQRQDGDEKVIAYASRVLEDRERRYSTIKKEICWPWSTLSSISATTCMEDPSQLGQTTMHLNGFRASKSPKAR